MASDTEPQIRVTYSGRAAPEIEAWLRETERRINENGIAAKVLKARDELSAFGFCVAVIE